jgi:hypothetical protein
MFYTAALSADTIHASPVYIANVLEVLIVEYSSLAVRGGLRYQMRSL